MVVNIRKTLVVIGYTLLFIAAIVVAAWTDNAATETKVDAYKEFVSSYLQHGGVVVDNRCIEKKIGVVK